MKIFGIETSCDETALSIVEALGDKSAPQFSVLGTALFSQVKIHEKYGGVFPELAKREHAKNLVPLLKKLLEEVDAKNSASGGAGGSVENKTEISQSQKAHLQKMLEREPELFEAFIKYIPTVNRPDIDAIAVTYGPGLEPALWVGINFAKALGFMWGLPIIPVNHMEGHIVSVLTSPQTRVAFPALALLISGGHTELVHISDWSEYKVVGETKDDAVGEAFDKVARMLSLPYPGGPQISKLAEKERADETSRPFTFPRPMLHTQDLDFSFSGLKTAVLYTIKKIPALDEKIKQQIAREFEDAVTEVLVEKTKKAISLYGAQTLIIGGGVIANSHIRAAFGHLTTDFPTLKIFVPEMSLTTDNAVMIAMAAYIRFLGDPNVLKTDPDTIRAQGNVRL